LLERALNKKPELLVVQKRCCVIELIVKSPGWELYVFVKE